MVAKSERSQNGKKSGKAGPSFNWRPATEAGAAFVLIFVVFSAGSAILAPALIEGLPSYKGGQIGPLMASELADLLVWSAFAVLAAVVAVAIVYWSVTLLSRHLERQLFLGVIGFLLVAVGVASSLSFLTPVATLQLPQILTCGSPPNLQGSTPFHCGLKPEAGFLKVIGWQAMDPPAWAGELLRLKIVLNLLFQAAAIFVIGSMLILASAHRAVPDRSAYRARLVQENVTIRLFVAGGIILSTVTLTDILFANWPLHTFQAEGPVRGAATRIMTAVTLYYAVLGSIVLALTLFFAREFWGETLPLWPSPKVGSPSEQWLKVAKAVFSGPVVKALITISPILTVLFSDVLGVQ